MTRCNNVTTWEWKGKRGDENTERIQTGKREYWKYNGFMNISRKTKSGIYIFCRGSHVHVGQQRREHEEVLHGSGRSIMDLKNIIGYRTQAVEISRSGELCARKGRSHIR